MKNYLYLVCKKVNNRGNITHFGVSREEIDAIYHSHDSDVWVISVPTLRDWCFRDDTLELRHYSSRGNYETAEWTNDRTKRFEGYFHDVADGEIEDNLSNLPVCNR